MVAGLVERQPEQDRLAQIVLRHPERLRDHFGGAELAVGFEQAGKQHWDRLDVDAIL